MTTSTRIAAFLLLFLLISETALAAEKGVGTHDNTVEDEKKVCKYKSKKFWGVCLSDIRCTDVCKREGFEGGDCQGIRRRCLCYNRCRH